jgi:spermidine synthase
VKNRRLFALIYAASGVAALVYEVAWTRMLTLQLGHTVAAASTVLAAFMGGLAVGAAVGGRVTNRLNRAQALRCYLILEIVVAALAVAVPLEVRALSPLLARTA